MKVLYVAYPYSQEPAERTHEVVQLVKALVAVRKDFVPLVPHVMFDTLLSENGEYPEGYDPAKVFVLDWELEVIDRCDGITFPPYPPGIRSAGIHWETAFARRMGIKIYSYSKLLQGLPFEECEE